MLWEVKKVCSLSFDMKEGSNLRKMKATSMFSLKNINIKKYIYIYI